MLSFEVAFLLVDVAFLLLVASLVRSRFKSIADEIDRDGAN